MFGKAEIKLSLACYTMTCVRKSEKSTKTHLELSELLKFTGIKSTNKAQLHYYILARTCGNIKVLFIIAPKKIKYLDVYILNVTKWCSKKSKKTYINGEM